MAKIEQHWPRELQNGRLCCSPIKTIPTIDHVLFAHVHMHVHSTNVCMMCVVNASMDRSIGAGYVLYRALVSDVIESKQVISEWSYRIVTKVQRQD